MPTAVEQVFDNPHVGAMPRLGAIKEKKGVPNLQTTATSLDIIDIRRVAVEINLKAEVLSQFRARDGPRTLPTLLLYDEKGLQLFEKVRLTESPWGSSSISPVLFGGASCQLSVASSPHANFSRSPTWMSTT